MTLETEFIDIVDTLDFTLSKVFIDKWKFKYGERLIRLFQLKIFHSLRKQKPIKLNSLYKFLVNDSGYNPDVVKDFFLDIDFEIYSPIISGRLKDLTLEN